MTAFYIPCTIYDTQYQVLKKLFEEVTREDIAGGYHTSQLQLKLKEALGDRAIVITLDELDFLLENDGSDLLYYLTRAGNYNKSIVTLSANISNLATAVDDRTYSSLQPRPVKFGPYSETEAGRIVSRRAHHGLQNTNVSKGALRRITTQTTNIRQALHWLAAAIKHGRGEFNERVVDETRIEGLHSYWDTLLADFSDHHRILLETIKELAEDSDQMVAGQVYDHYGSLCQRVGRTRLTDRRISDFLKHLELLGIIEADYHYGGKHGKTRIIKLNEL